MNSVIYSLLVAVLRNCCTDALTTVLVNAITSVVNRFREGDLTQPVYHAILAGFYLSARQADQ